MTYYKSEYLLMMNSFLQGIITTSDFVTAYLKKFKVETKEFDEKEFAILVELFGDIDAYTPDVELLAENPNFYLDSVQMRKSVERAMAKLNAKD